MGLTAYRQKRRFAATPEPKGSTRRRRARKLQFVIQKHAARRLHYDFRLELDGVLKSWAVPKGPCLDPHEKRLAVEVEDHPLDYATFEGTIPAGNYGAGEVIVWDRGTWQCSGDPHQQLARGKLEFDLDGEKLRGGWVLLRMHQQPSNKPNWLLIKRRDAEARELAEYDITESEPNSVRSGRRLVESKTNGHAKNTLRNRRGMEPAAHRRASPTASAANADAGPALGASLSHPIPAPQAAKSRKAKLPDAVEPHLAVLAEKTPSGKEWLHEIKWDGYRLLSYIEGGEVRLMTRKQQDWTHRYPEIAKAIQKLPVKKALLDGELVSVLPNGLTSFQSLQNFGRDPNAGELAYYLFDLLHLDGFDLRGVPLIERKAMLGDLLARSPQPRLHLSEHLESDGPAFFQQCCGMGLEGVVSKRRDQPYRSGRWDDWIKTKCLAREELVIGGYTLSTAMPRAFGALLVGYFDNDALVYAGRVGTGFTMQTLRDLRTRFEQLTQTKSPFQDVPAKERTRQTRWVKPELVAQIEFTGWTEDAILRHPSFQGLREDKPASEVGRPPTLTPRTSRKPKPGSVKRTAQSNRVTSSLTHPDRVLFADCGLTKLGLADYYAQVSDRMLPHLIDRPLSLVRCPKGAEAGKCFFQKHVAAATPASLRRIDIQEHDKTEQYVVVEDLAGLLALVQMSVLEIHPWGSRRDQLERPDRLIFDLDPGPEVSWPRVIQGACELREQLSSHGLKAYLKTTGGKGLHLVVPLAPRRHDWETVKTFARDVANQFATADSLQYTTSPKKAQRRGKIFIDYLRNDRGATAIAPYSTRAKPDAPVALPLAWEELSPAMRADHFHVNEVLARLAAVPRDPWADMWQVKQQIPSGKARTR